MAHDIWLKELKGILGANQHCNWISFPRSINRCKFWQTNLVFCRLERLFFSRGAILKHTWWVYLYLLIFDAICFTKIVLCLLVFLYKLTLIGLCSLETGWALVWKLTEKLKSLSMIKYARMKQITISLSFHGIIFILYLLEETIQQRSFVESLL